MSFDTSFYNLFYLFSFERIEASHSFTRLTLSLPKANLTKSRKLLNPEMSNET